MPESALRAPKKYKSKRNNYTLHEDLDIESELESNSYDDCEPISKLKKVKNIMRKMILQMDLK